MRILFVASEGLPFSKTGGLADVIEALPKTLAANGHEVAVLLPRYKKTPATGLVLSRLSIPIGGETRESQHSGRHDRQRRAVFLRGRSRTISTATSSTAPRRAIIPITPSGSRSFRGRRSKWRPMSGSRT